MIRRRIAACMAALVIVWIGLLAFFFYRERPIAYSWVYSYKIETPVVGQWRVVSDRGFFTGKNFAQEYALQTGEPLPDEIDTANHTYIVCYGFTLEELSYREMDKSGRFTSDAAYYYVKATLQTAPSALANVYLVDDPIAIDRDMHTNYRRDTMIIN